MVGQPVKPIERCHLRVRQLEENYVYQSDSRAALPFEALLRLEFSSKFASDGLGVASREIQKWAIWGHLWANPAVQRGSNGGQEPGLRGPQ